MIPPASILLPYSLFVLTVITVWLRNSTGVATWIPFAIATLISATLAGHLTGVASIALTVFGVLAYLSVRSDIAVALRVLMALALLAMAGFFATHSMPGFHNPLLLHEHKFSPDALPFTQRANFDKGMAGLLLLVFFCERSKSWQEWTRVMLRTVPIALITCLFISGIATALHYSRLDIKLPSYTPVFLLTNLFFTCFAEEALFRGLIQHRMSRWLGSRHVKRAGLIALICTSSLFGLVHTGGGWGYVLLATVAGLGYGYAFMRTERIEAPILVHFCVNAMHFLGFTYPRLA